MDFLTHPQLTLTIPLSQQVTTWFSSHKKHKMPIARLSDRLRFQMQKIYFGGLYWGRESVQDSCVLSTNPNNVHRPKFSSLKRCPQSITRGHTMSQNNSNALNSEQTQTLDKLNQSFVNVCFAYADLNAYLSKADLEISPCRFVWITSEIANLSEELEALRTGGAK